MCLRFSLRCLAQTNGIIGPKPHLTLETQFYLHDFHRTSLSCEFNIDKMHIISPSYTCSKVLKLNYQDLVFGFHTIIYFSLYHNFFFLLWNLSYPFILFFFFLFTSQAFSVSYTLSARPRLRVQKKWKKKKKKCKILTDFRD